MSDFSEMRRRFDKVIAAAIAEKCEDNSAYLSAEQYIQKITQI